MTLFFNIEKLVKESKGNTQKILSLLELHYDKKSLASCNINGFSFLLNPKPLFHPRNKFDILYKIQYIKLAAYRDYAMYKLYGITYLDLSYFPDININAIKTNPLLTLKDNKIFFKYEEKQIGTK